MITLFFLALSALLQLFFFSLESLLWGTPRVNKLFQLTAEQAEANRLFALNQGYYNLFIAVGMIVGMYLLLSGHRVAGLTLAIFTCASMLAAALVLLGSTRNLRGTLAQGLAPLCAILTMLFC